jgi:hypothetical protein
VDERSQNLQTSEDALGAITWLSAILSAVIWAYASDPVIIVVGLLIGTVGFISWINMILVASMPNLILREIDLIWSVKDWAIRLKWTIVFLTALAIFGLSAYHGVSVEAGEVIHFAGRDAVWRWPFILSVLLTVAVLPFCTCELNRSRRNWQLWRATRDARRNR